MIDTIRWRLYGNVGHGVEVTGLSSGWEVRQSKINREGDQGLPVETVIFTNTDTGMRLLGQGSLQAGVVNTVEVSLPRLLFGTNGRVISDQRQLDESICLLRKEASAILGEDASLTEDHLTRVDLVWQFRRDPAEMVEDLRKSRHPQIKKGNRVYEGESVNFPGKERFLRVYDKTREQKGRRGDVTRVELQLRGKALQAALGNGDQKVMIGDLNWFRCYHAYREFLMKFEPIRKPVLTKFIALLAWMVKEDAKGNDGQLVFDLWANGKSPRYVQQTRNRIAKFNFQYKDWTFGELLPDDPKSESLELSEVV